MKFFPGVVVSLFGLTTLVAESVTPALFPQVAELESAAGALPVRVALPREIVASDDDSFSGLRLFDSNHRATPYVIYPERGYFGETRSFDFTVIDFKSSANGSEGQITLERPASLQDAGGTLELQLVTPSRDFQKKVVILASNDKKSWRTVTTDSWFDFSSQTNFRRVAFSQPLPNARYLRLQFSDEKNVSTSTPALRLRYRDLEFTAPTGNEVKPFQIERIEGVYHSSQNRPATDELITWDNPKMTLDQEGNSLLPLGSVNLPTTELRLRVDNPYYYRQVLLQGANDDKPEAYVTIGEGTVYRIPGAASYDNVIKGPFIRKPFLRLKVLNGPNPPLQISSVQIAWRRLYLYFVPTQGGSYQIGWGGNIHSTPNYELKALLSSDPKVLTQYPTVVLTALGPNAHYVTPTAPPPPRSDETERWLLRGFIGLLLIGLGAWAYTLMRKLQRPSAN